jgi:hypothetical protein
MKRRPRRCGPGGPPPRDQPVTGKPSAAPERSANPEPSAAQDQPVTGEPSPAPEQAAACGQSTACEQVATREQPASRERSSGRDARTDRGAAALAAVRAGPGPTATVRAGVREPIVIVLLLIAFFTSISGKPLDGLLMLVAGVSLAWDTARRSRRASLTASGPHGDGQPGRSQAESRPADLSPPEHHYPQTAPWRNRRHLARSPARRLLPPHPGLNGPGSSQDRASRWPRAADDDCWPWAGSPAVLCTSWW